jgi:LmbE family N-acetylglucosaminyl deacetylase
VATDHFGDHRDGRPLCVIAPLTFGDVATAVILHAHPDDETIATGGLIAKAKRDGHRIVLVVATKGEEGEPVPGVLAEGELLGDRRVRETQLAAEVLGVDRVAFLGYRDSGMMGEPTNDNPASFWQADLHEAATKLAQILTEEDADLVVTYDENGVYGHPDHIQVHRVGVRAAEYAGVSRVFEATFSREFMRDIFADLEELEGEDQSGPADADTFGLPEAQLTHRVDVSDFVLLKRAALLRHESQISPDHPMAKMAIADFARWSSVEWYRDRARTRDGGAFLDDVFAMD